MAVTINELRLNRFSVQEKLDLIERLADVEAMRGIGVSWREVLAAIRAHR